MRILAIRGQNLASLGEPFCLDFQQAPLAHAGLYAITGPTGSGKTTILDAMCLALFDDVPRYQRRGHLRTSDAKQADGLHEGDARNVLRRGAVAAFAEVDFSGRDGHAYRARWSVRRARRKPDGNIQASELALTRIADGKILGDQRKNDTKVAIQEKLGLDYAQFLRSVLLAQGDFAAFLQAGEKERAELLERLTGAEIYTQLSKAAFQRYQQAAADLKALRDQMDQVAVLTDEERERLDAALHAAESALKESQQRQKSYEADAAWYRRCNELKHAVDAAVSDLEKATAARSKLVPVADKVAAVQRAVPLQPYWETLQRHRQHLRELRVRWTDAQSKLAVSEREFHSAQRTLAAAQQGEKAVQAEHLAAQPDLKAARALDVSIREREGNARELSQQIEGLDKDLGERQRAVTAVDKAQQALSGELEAVNRWFKERTGLQPMMEQWAGVQRDLRQLSDLQHCQVEDRDRLQRLQATFETERQQVDECGKQRKRLDGDVKASEATLQALKKELTDANEQLSQAEQLDLKRRRSVLASLEAALALWQNRHNVFVDAEQHLTTLRSAIRDSEQARDQAHEAAIRLEGQEAECERHLAQVQAQSDLADRRAELLQSEEPCPLCGSREHPFADGEQAATSDLVQAAQQRLADVRKQLNEQRQTQASQATSAEEKQAQADALRAELATTAPQIEQAKVDLDTWLSRWHALLPEQATKLVFDSENKQQPALVAALDEALEDVTARENNQEALRQGLKALRADQDKQQTQLDQLRAQREQVLEKLAALEKRLATLTTEIQALQGKLNSTDEQRDKLLETLAVYQDDAWFSVGLAEDAAAFFSAAEQLASAWQAKQVKQTECETACEKKQQELAAKNADLQARAEQRQPLQAQYELATAALQDLHVQRQGYFAGRAADEEEARLQKALNNAVSTREVASVAERAASDAREKAMASAIELAKQLVLAQAEVIEAQAVWRARLDLDTLDEATVLPLLAKSGTWLREQQALVKTADQAVRDAQTVANERRQQLTAHRETDPPEVDRETLAAEFATLAEELETRTEQRDAYRLAVRQDNERRQQFAEWMPKLQGLAAKADRWEIMSQLIGSADGTKFRAYAQSLTLETLVQLANEQLQDLEPRYQLQRQPQTDLALVVIDRFMGDEVRSLNSLSGGESFLLSLALALSLSALTAGHTPIESLFIDEGFGTLDGRTLDTALAALESLQASGRSVGVISHVQAMIENIGVRVDVIPTGGGDSSIRVIED